MKATQFASRSTRSLGTSRQSGGVLKRNIGSGIESGGFVPSPIKFSGLNRMDMNRSINKAPVASRFGDLHRPDIKVDINLNKHKMNTLKKSERSQLANRIILINGQSLLPEGNQAQHEMPKAWPIKSMVDTSKVLFEQKPVVKNETSNFNLQRTGNNIFINRNAETNSNAKTFSFKQELSKKIEKPVSISNNREISTQSVASPNILPKQVVNTEPRILKNNQLETTKLSNIPGKFEVAQIIEPNLPDNPYQADIVVKSLENSKMPNVAPETKSDSTNKQEEQNQIKLKELNYTQEIESVKQIREALSMIQRVDHLDVQTVDHEIQKPDVIPQELTSLKNKADKKNNVKEKSPLKQTLLKLKEKLMSKFNKLLEVKSKLKPKKEKDQNQAEKPFRGYARDEATNKVRLRTILRIARVLFENKKNKSQSIVTGQELISKLPFNEHTIETKSHVLQGSIIPDGSIPGFIQSVGNQSYSTYGEIYKTAKDAIRSYTAIKRSIRNAVSLTAVAQVFSGIKTNDEEESSTTQADEKQSFLYRLFRKKNVANLPQSVA